MEEKALAPTAQSIPEALPGRVIVEFPKDKKEDLVEHKSGLILFAGSAAVEPEEQKDVATVISVGDGTDKAEEMFTKIVKPGMRVIADKHVGVPFFVGKDEARREFFIYRSFEIVGYLP